MAAQPSKSSSHSSPVMIKGTNSEVYAYIQVVTRPREHGVAAQPSKSSSLSSPVMIKGTNSEVYAYIHKGNLKTHTF